MRAPGPKSLVSKFYLGLAIFSFVLALIASYTGYGPEPLPIASLGVTIYAVHIALRPEEKKGENTRAELGEEMSASGALILSVIVAVCVVFLFVLVVAWHFYPQYFGKGDQAMGNAIQIGTIIVTFFTFVSIAYYANQLRKSSEAQKRNVEAQLVSFAFPVVATVFNQGWRNYEDDEEDNEHFGAPGLNFIFSENRPFYVYISFQSTQPEGDIKVYHPWMLTEYKVGVHPGESLANHRKPHNLRENEEFEEQLTEVFEQLGSGEEKVIAEVGILFESANRMEFFQGYEAEFQFKREEAEVELSSEGELNFNKVFLDFDWVEPSGHSFPGGPEEHNKGSEYHLEKLKERKRKDRQRSENSESGGG